ncbi:MAG: hypothetical protein WCO58_01840 [bacterium]
MKHLSLLRYGVVAILMFVFVGNNTGVLAQINVCPPSVDITKNTVRTYTISDVIAMAKYPEQRADAFLLLNKLIDAQSEGYYIDADQWTPSFQFLIDSFPAYRTDVVLNIQKLYLKDKESFRVFLLNVAVKYPAQNHNVIDVFKISKDVVGLIAVKADLSYMQDFLEKNATNEDLWQVCLSNYHELGYKLLLQRDITDPMFKAVIIHCSKQNRKLFWEKRLAKSSCIPQGIAEEILLAQPKDGPDTTWWSITDSLWEKSKTLLPAFTVWRLMYNPNLSFRTQIDADTVIEQFYRSPNNTCSCVYIESAPEGYSFNFHMFDYKYTDSVYYPPAQVGSYYFRAFREFSAMQDLRLIQATRDMLKQGLKKNLGKDALLYIAKQKNIELSRKEKRKINLLKEKVFS